MKIPSLSVRFAWLLFLVLGPFIFAAIRAPDFTRVPSRFGNFFFINYEIEQEKSDIDVLILGSSTALTAFDVPLLEKKFEEAGHKINIVNLSLTWAYSNASYLILRRILEKRRVGLVLWEISPSLNSSRLEHPASLYFFNPLRDFAWAHRLGADFIAPYLGAALMSAPRNFVELFQSSAGKKLRKPYLRDLEILRASGGTLLKDKGYEPRHGPGKPFVLFRPTPPVVPVNRMLFRGDTGDPRYQETDDAFPEHMEKIMLMAKRIAAEHGARFALTSIGVSPLEKPFQEFKFQTAELSPRKVSFLTVSPADLWKSVDPADYTKFFFNDLHFNSNGAAFISSVLSPALIHLYESEVLGAKKP
jgi:hypothetical protein